MPIYDSPKRPTVEQSLKGIKESLEEIQNLKKRRLRKAHDKKLMPPPAIPKKRRHSEESDPNQLSPKKQKILLEDEMSVEEHQKRLKESFNQSQKPTNSLVKKMNQSQTPHTSFTHHIKSPFKTLSLFKYPCKTSPLVLESAQTNSPNKTRTNRRCRKS